MVLYSCGSVGNFVRDPYFQEGLKIGTGYYE